MIYIITTVFPLQPSALLSFALHSLTESQFPICGAIVQGHIGDSEQTIPQMVSWGRNGRPKTIVYSLNYVMFPPLILSRSDTLWWDILHSGAASTF